MAAKRNPDAIALLKADHEKVTALFERFERSRQDAVKKRTADTICEELRVHTQIEEEIFYPAVREGVDDQDVVNEAAVEHEGAKRLVEEIAAADPGDELYDAKVKVLSEYIKHHVKEEQGKMFPMARKAKLDLQELGGQLAQRKRELQGAPARGRGSSSASRAGGDDTRRRTASERAG
jgi:iron-sulfur cluster repair protein YtfE (RIC family)